ncbi:pentatricopeptide repeat-containing protein, mitochondrial [Iris pallida]|uniref:Pentatricopeptide repeat-containing protein, mitochondrial n=1 Tax=Iris pallida TaxID=29817 RepID=A0AAX6DYN3_IRIPA|nr:pentatricopeptide repeat-containing protein, mitochondrial [Iris pallida]
MIQIRSSCTVFELLLMLMTLFSLSLSLSPTTVRYTVMPTQPLAGNQTLISSKGRFGLGFFIPAAGSASMFMVCIVLRGGRNVVCSFKFGIWIFLSFFFGIKL